MVAFTGSYATEGFEYPTWQDFLLQSVKGVSPKMVINWTNEARKKIRRKDTNSPSYFGIFEEQEGKIDNRREGIAGGFLLRDWDATLEPKDTSRALADALGIHRVITLNYDLELEWHFMTTKLEKLSRLDRQTFFNELIVQKNVKCSPIESLTRTLPDGRSAVSDIFDRERTDRLIEFAVGSPDDEAHIMHLHGRANSPLSMIVSLRDYQRQYRRSSISKLPFEHAQRILFAGNPVMFLGLGMSEDYINSVLEQFVSDRADRFVAPAFVLWSAKQTTTGLADAELRRLFWYHRYRVLTIFDHELENFAPQPDQYVRMASSLGILGAYAEKHGSPKSWKMSEFRSAQTRLSDWSNEQGFHIWRREGPADQVNRDIISPTVPKAAYKKQPSQNSDLRDWPIYEALFCGEPVKAIIHSPGWGHGWLSKAISEAFENGEKLPNPSDPKASVINASFVCEIDSAFSLISGLYDGKTAAQQYQSRLAGLKMMMAQLASSPRPDKHVLLVINGMDRFLDTSGRPLSAELDTMIRASINLYSMSQPIPPAGPQLPSSSIAPLSIVATGTERVRRYLAAIRPEFVCLNDCHVELDQTNQTVNLIDELRTRAFANTSLAAPPQPKSRYFDAVSSINNLKNNGPSFLDASIRSTQQRRTGEYRHAFLSMLIRSSTLTKALKDAGKDERLADLCLEIIAVLALVGQPCEQAILDADAGIKKRISALKTGGHGDPLLDALKFLSEKLFILQFAPFTPSVSPTVASPRFGLHRSVMAEMRDRFGLPISDARLSCGFNLSLYVSQPTDDYTPDREMQNRLGDLFDALLKDDIDPVDQSLPGLLVAKSSEDIRACCPGKAQRMRAALAILRSYLSISTLLMQQPESGHKGRNVADGIAQASALAQHVDRLERIVRAAENCAKVRGEVLADTALTSAHPHLGQEIFFPDDMVWLHNELGVTLLAQGDLYEARQAFSQAERINTQFVEFTDRLQNWQRIQLNLLHSDIERGKISSAEGRIRDLEAAITNNHQPAALSNEGRSKTLLDEVYEKYGHENMSKITAVDEKFRFDTVLALGLIAGYRGWVYLLSGKRSTSIRSLEVANKVLGNIGELRACSMFERFRSSWFDQNHDHANAIASAKLSIASAESVHHLDIAHLSQIAKATYQLHGSDLKNSSMITRQLRKSLEYGYSSDIYRARIDARQALAASQLLGGDYDGALEHASDAMAIATRFGFSLKKTTLRTLIGQILIKRGDRVSGQALIQQAMRNADRIGYQRALEHAREVNLEEDL